MKLNKLLDIIDKVNERVGTVIAFGLIVMMFIMLYEVVLRYIFDSPTIWAWDVNGLLFSAVLVLGGGYVLLHKGHVRLDILFERLSPRGRLIADIATFPVFLIFLSVVVWQGGRMAYSSLVMGQHTLGFFNAPIYPTKIAFCVAAALLLLQGIAIFTRNVIALKGKTNGRYDASNT